MTLTLSMTASPDHGAWLASCSGPGLSLGLASGRTREEAVLAVKARMFREVARLLDSGELAPSLPFEIRFEVRP